MYLVGVPQEEQLDVDRIRHKAQTLGLTSLMPSAGDAHAPLVLHRISTSVCFLNGLEAAGEKKSRTPYACVVFSPNFGDVLLLEYARRIRLLHSSPNVALFVDTKMPFIDASDIRFIVR